MVKYYSKTFFFSFFDLSHIRSFFYHYRACDFLTVSFQRKCTLPEQRSIFQRKMLASQLSPEETHKPSMFQSYIRVILSYLKLFYFILNLCIAEQLFTPHISVVYFISSQIRQLLIKHAWMVSWLCKRIGSVNSWLCKAMQCRLGQGRAGLPGASQDLHTLQFTIFPYIT